MSNYVEGKQEVQVNKDALWKLVDYCWHDEWKDYVKNPSDDHIFMSLMPLAAACDYVEYEEQEWAEIREELEDNDD